jgi:hypothetical protein
MSTSRPLFVPSEDPVGENPFSTDKFNRLPLAGVLNGYLKRLKFGAVIAIDAQWGEGKTWFALNWKKMLNDEGHTAIYIDAFEADYIEDPFSIIAGEVQAVIQSSPQRSSFISRAANVALAIAPTALKIAVRGTGKVLLGISDLDGTIKDGVEKIFENTEESLGKIFEEKIKNYNDDKKSISAFRDALSSFAGSLESPLVVMIDELDRCKPEFSVKLLERIKHFFNVPNVVFILLMNKRQMHNAIKGVYGEATDAHLYLEKFLNFTFVLEPPKQEHIRPFVDHILKKYDIVQDNQVDQYVSGICDLSAAFKMTSRQLERAIALLALAYPFQTGGILLAELAILKTCRPDLLEGLLNSEVSSIDQIIALLYPYRSNKNSTHFEGWIEFLIAVHQAQAEPSEGDATKHLQQMFQTNKHAVTRDYRRFVSLLNMLPRS